MENPKMVTEKSWEDFRSSGMMWFANRILHMFGWVLVADVELGAKDGEVTNTVNRVYPARTKFRGFSADAEERGFKNVTKFVKDNIDTLLNEVES